LPFLTRGQYLQIPTAKIRSKKYLSARDIGKGKKQIKGYVPDFMVVEEALPVFVIEAKSPSYSALQAYDEARLYAAEMNVNFPTSVNPCRFVMGTNGIDLHLGYWDAQPHHSVKIEDLELGSSLLDLIQADFNMNALDGHAKTVSKEFTLNKFSRPFNKNGGQAMIASKKGQNSFAPEISPVLTRYFSSREQNKDPEIHKYAYVSSAEVTSYDGVLDGFLKDRVAKQKSRSQLQTKKTGEPKLSRRIKQHIEERPTAGDIQLITGGVGSGKSLFARRYKEILLPAEIKDSTHWAFINFNNSPADLLNSEEWLYESFVTSLIEEGAPIDLGNADDQERIFSDKLRLREPFYERANNARENEGMLERARDIEQWRHEPKMLAEGISRYIQGDCGDTIVVVFDNVDRKNAEEQLTAFQHAMNFKTSTKSLVLLPMRDSTFDLYNDQPPLDTYRTGTVFHISPPRFVDVVKKRLLLSIAKLSESADETLSYKTPSGAQITYPSTEAGAYLTKIYTAIFDRRGNLSRIIEALSGRDVRRALDMFISIISSGHMPEDIITRVTIGGHLLKFPEHLIIRILMRGDNRFFSDKSGFISNIFYSSNQWHKPSNLLVIELLFFLLGKRKVQGDNGHQGYFSLKTIISRLENMGFSDPDTLDAIKFALTNNLLETDNFSQDTEALTEATCMKATASAWAHMRFLSGRDEYLLGVMPTTPINLQSLIDKVYGNLRHENSFGKISFARKIDQVEQFIVYIEAQYEHLSQHPGFHDQELNGSKYVIQKMKESLRRMKNAGNQSEQMDLLDN